MANIFKTTLKKDVIADIANNHTREIRFPITKFWATRLSDKYDIDGKEFTFKTFDSLELSSPSNKGTEGATYTFEFVRTFVDGEEFVVEFKEDGEGFTIIDGEGECDCCPTEEVVTVELDINETKVVTELYETPTVEVKDIEEDIIADSDVDETEYITNEDVFELIKQWFEDERVLENFYESESVFATNARQVIILPKGKILGSKRTLPVNNDVEVRIEFDMNKKIYFDSIPDFDVFEEEVYRNLDEIRKNNFVFVWRRNTGIFMDNEGRVYFGIKYSTRKSIGFNRRYNVQ
jgi:hypothetical protein